MGISTDMLAAFVRVAERRSVTAAADDLAFYLAECGDAPDAPALRERLAELLGQRSPPLQ